MEDLVVFSQIYTGIKVLVTGHTGFKGSWLTLWLQQLGAEVYGYSLENPPSTPNHFSLLKSECESFHGDIRNPDSLQKAVAEIQPDIVFHLAAQPLVRTSYESPVETFETNCLGTVNLLEAVRSIGTVKAVVVVTSDKCYENLEDGIPFIESDPMGGSDPYSASKGAAEIIVNSYRTSFFNPELYGKTHNTIVASVRAGNVIGGGDWGEARLIPDIMKAAAHNETVEIRSPYAIRPWQHVLEPLSGYLMVGQRLLEGDISSAGGWNFGPESEGHLTVGDVCDRIRKIWDSTRFCIAQSVEYHEAQTLKLDCTKAARILGWKPVWNADETIEKTVEWYKQFYESGKVCSEEQLDFYVEDAQIQEKPWVN